MTKCYRICGAYSFRLMRRHSTISLILTFIVCLTIIFQLYAYRHHDRQHSDKYAADFNYEPGYFLKGKQPVENVSYCEFNYGLPDKLEWDSIKTYPSPAVGKKSKYLVIYDAIKGTAYSNYTRYEAVTYATHATPEFIYHIVEIARHWEGPISLAVFVPGYDLDITMQIMYHLCHCYSGMSKVSLHLYYPNHYRPTLRTRFQISVTSLQPPITTMLNIKEIIKKKIEMYHSLNNKTRADHITKVRQDKIKRMMSSLGVSPNEAPLLHFKDCTGGLQMNTFRKTFHILYPINIGRNVARNASRTNYFIVSDIEMIPSEGLASKFLIMLRKLMGDKKRNEGCVFDKTIFVVPLFEVQKGEPIPRDKQTLVEMVTANRAAYFHHKLCPHCQRFPGMQSWLIRAPSDILEPMLIARREFPYHRWEPLYFGTHKEPWYREELSWEGLQDKMIQMLELCLLEYRMVVLDGGFLCHVPEDKNVVKHQNVVQERDNQKKYIRIATSFLLKYPERKECRAGIGLKKKS